MGSFSQADQSFFHIANNSEFCFLLSISTVIPFVQRLIVSYQVSCQTILIGHFGFSLVPFLIMLQLLPKGLF